MLTRTRTSSYFTWLTVLTVLSLLLAACGGTQSPTAAPAAATLAPAAATSAPAAGTSAPAAAGAGVTHKLAQPVTIEIFTALASVQLPPPGNDWFLTKAIKDQLNIDLKISWQSDLSEYDRLLATRAAANDLPDLFQSSANLGRDLGAQGLLADWTPYLKTMPNFVKEREVQRLAPIGTLDGKLYNLTTKSPNPFKQAVAIRQDWLDKLGLQAPKTLDDYLAVMKAFTTKDPDGNGKADTYGWTGSVDSAGNIQQFDPIFGAFGALGDWRVDNNQLVYVPTSPERRDALQFINRMRTEGVLDPDWSSQTGTDRGNKWKSGKIGIFHEDWCATWCAALYKPFADANPTGRLVDIAPPVGPSGKSAISTYLQVGFRYGMSQRAVDQGKGEAIATLLEWLTTDGYYLAAFGEEGKTWHREGNKILMDATDTALIATALRAWAVKASDEELRARYDVTTKASNGQTIDVWQIEQRAQQMPRVDITDFAALPLAAGTQAADLARLKAEGELKFATGQRPFTEWDAYVQSLKAAGLDAWQAQAAQKAKEIGLIK